MSLSKKSCAGTALENFLLRHHSHGLELSVWINDLNGKNRALEGNKSLACRALRQTNVPVPHSVLFSNHDQLRALMNRPCPFVVKFEYPWDVQDMHQSITDPLSLARLDPPLNLHGSRHECWGASAA